MIADMKAAHLGPRQTVAQDNDPIQIPNDIYYQISMGADVGHMPQDTLMTVQGLDEDAGSTQKAYMTPGDFCIVAGKDKLPIVLGVLMGIVQANGAEQGLLFGCSWFVFFVFFGFLCCHQLQLISLTWGLLGIIHWIRQSKISGLAEKRKSWTFLALGCLRTPCRWQALRLCHQWCNRIKKFWCGTLSRRSMRKTLSRSQSPSRCWIRWWTSTTSISPVWAWVPPNVGICIEHTAWWFQSVDVQRERRVKNGSLRFSECPCFWTHSWCQMETTCFSARVLN